MNPNQRYPLEMDIARRSLLDQILAQPTAPFREGHVITTIVEALEKGKVPHFIDPVGNILVGVKSPKEYKARVAKKTREPLRVFIAHMDHPGFHGANWTQAGELEVKWHGGTPTAHLEGSKVWLASRGDWRGQGQVVSAEMHSNGRMITAATIRLDESSAADARQSFKDPSDIFGGFGFRAPVWQEGDLIYTKAADDLVGAFSIVSVAIDLWKKRSPQRDSFIGLLSRAEEVGFIGAIGHFELGWLKTGKKAARPLMAVSLETSRTLPGAEIGKGPVVRLGDRFTVFDAGYLRVFSMLAEKVLPGRHQRRIMDGGSCEATAATVYGIPAIGISVPLGNYHNQCFEGGPDSRGPLGPAPEFVHLGDVAGLLALCQGIMKPKLPWTDPWTLRLKDFKKSMRTYGSLIKSKP